MAPGAECLGPEPLPGLQLFILLAALLWGWKEWKKGDYDRTCLRSNLPAPRRVSSEKEEEDPGGVCGQLGLLVWRCRGQPGRRRRWGQGPPHSQGPPGVTVSSAAVTKRPTQQAFLIILEVRALAWPVLVRALLARG